MKHKRKINIKKILVLILFISIIFLFIFNKLPNSKKEDVLKKYLAADNKNVVLYTDDFKEYSKIARGQRVNVYSKIVENKGKIYYKIKYKDKFYYVEKNNLVDKKSDVVKENKMYVRTNATVYSDDISNKIESLIKKSDEVLIVGFDKLNKDGSVEKYKISYNDITGYVYSKYLVETLELSKKVYDSNGLVDYMNKMGDTLGGGNANNLDYYPVEKPSFSDNQMPEEIRSIYINGAAIKDIDEYIEFAKSSNINAFVIDLKDNTSPSYNSDVMKNYSKTNYDHALNEYEDFKKYVKKAKEAGIYLIGRITTFKDSYFVEDHPEVAIKNSNGDSFSHNGSYWPSAFNRLVWEFNVSLGIEAVKDMGFNEIQFDYVRFPDRTNNLEKQGVINFSNVYNEEKAQAIQEFVMYATDEIHKYNAYVSIDVFGESSNNYVTAYGQFWSAISNVADVISGMPYPDHFNAHEYGIGEVVWTVPYKVLYEWGKTVKEKQEIIPTPAIVRTWIQTYNVSKTPSVIYDSTKISDQIQALYDNDLKGGYMTWNSASNIYKYREVSSAFKKVY